MPPKGYEPSGSIPRYVQLHVQNVNASFRTFSVVCGDESSVSSKTCHCKIPVSSACIMAAAFPNSLKLKQ